MMKNIYKDTKISVKVLDGVILAGIMTLAAIIGLQF